LKAMPKRFVFRLQAVLNHRQRIEEIKRRGFIQANLRRLQEKKRLDYFYRAKDLGLESLHRLERPGVIDLDQVRFYYDYQFGLGCNIERQSRRLKEAAEAVERAKQELIQASKDKKVLENLKEKHFHEYLLDLDRQEQKFLDDIATGRYARARRGNYPEVTGGNATGQYGSLV